MKKEAILLASLLIFSCSSEELDVNFVEPETQIDNNEDGAEVEVPEDIEVPGDSIIANQQKFGQLVFSSDFGQEKSAKGPIPLCTVNTPESIRYTLENDSVRVYTSKVDIQNGQVFSIEPIDILEGTYSVTDLTLFDADGNQTHRVPDATDESFAQFTDRPTPFDITIVSGEESDAGSNIMCWTGDTVYTTIGGNTVTKLRTLNMYYNSSGFSTDGYTGCVDLLTVDLYWKGQTEPERIYEKDVVRVGPLNSSIYSAPVPAEMDSVVATSWASGYNELNLEQKYIRESFTFYPDTFPTEHIGEMVYFRNSCE